MKTSKASPHLSRKVESHIRVSKLQELMELPKGLEKWQTLETGQFEDNAFKTGGGKRMTGPMSPEFYFLKTSGFGETL